MTQPCATKHSNEAHYGPYRIGDFAIVFKVYHVSNIATTIVNPRTNFEKACRCPKIRGGLWHLAKKTAEIQTIHNMPAPLLYIQQYAIFCSRFATCHLLCLSGATAQVSPTREVIWDRETMMQ